MNTTFTSSLLVVLLLVLVASTQAATQRRLPYNCDYKSGKKGASCDTPSCCDCDCHPSGEAPYAHAQVCDCDCSGCGDDDDDDDDDDDEDDVCAADVKACPDGSYVSRNPDNHCEFDPCDDDYACEVCKNGAHMNNPNGQIEIPGQILECRDLYQLKPNQCYQLPEEIQGVCGCYEPCNVCGNGAHPSYEDEYVFVPGWGMETCGDVYDYGAMGGLTEDECDAVPDYVFDTCGCDDDAVAPVSSPPCSGGKKGGSDCGYSGKKGGGKGGKGGKKGGDSSASYGGKKGGYSSSDYGGKKGGYSSTGYGEGKGGSSYGKKGGYSDYAPVESPTYDGSYSGKKGGYGGKGGKGGSDYSGKKGGYGGKGGKGGSGYSGKKGGYNDYAPVQTPDVCALDIHICPDGTELSRDVEDACSFPDCPDPVEHYCTVPNYNCYDYGFPECCYEGAYFDYCPDSPPPCDVDDDDDDSGYTGKKGGYKGKGGHGGKKGYDGHDDHDDDSDDYDGDDTPMPKYGDDDDDSHGDDDDYETPMPKYGDDDDDDDDDHSGKNGKYQFAGKKRD